MSVGLYRDMFFCIICWISFLHCIVFAPLTKISWLHLCGLFMSSLSCSIDLFVSSLANTTLSWLLWLDCMSWSQYCQSLDFVLLQNWVGYSVFFSSLYNRWINLLISRKITCGVVISLQLICRSYWEKLASDNMESFYPYFSIRRHWGLEYISKSSWF